MQGGPDFARFDRRHYETVSAREGYDAWAPTYEETVEDVMDLALLERIGSVGWDGVGRAADLGCGSGRTAAWLRTRGDFPVDGVDLTPAMLDARPGPRRPRPSRRGRRARHRAARRRL